MTDEELVKRLRSYAKDQGGWHNIDDTCEEAADRIEALTAELTLAEQRGYANAMEAERKLHEDRIEALTKERNALRSALNRIRPIPERILRGIPVRDLAETLAEADSALIKGESHE
jgi:ParB-like chromosome segregation protein Spo0J